MRKIFLILLGAMSWLWVSGCASELKRINQGANKTGQAVGGAARIPNSLMEGAASGAAGQSSPNPYNR
ncbi:MAG: hypothetical protein WCP12_13910 [bacterium]